MTAAKPSAEEMLSYLGTMLRVVTFTQDVPEPVIRALEDDGLIEVHRPVHGGTGLSYSEEYWSVEVTEEGIEFYHAHI